MRQTTFYFILFLLSAVSSPVFSQWAPAGDRIKTRWAAEVDPAHVLPEYPRPIMKRADWTNLNGLWKFEIVDRGSAMPGTFNGQILVPFPVESSLSGVMKNVGSEKEVWYQRSLEVPSSWKKKQVLLHFGAVDWRTDVWINDIKIGSHEGGYSPFTFNISPYLGSGKQTITVRVWDPTNDGPQPRGKQVNQPRGIWYTPVTGIWQTVWMEPVADNHITGVKATPDIDHSVIRYAVSTEGSKAGDLFEVKVYDEGKLLATRKAAAGQEMTISIPEPHLWSPEDPYLYTARVSLMSNGRMQDEVETYFAMRKISVARDENGIQRIQLNNKDYFQFGPLDQGWWPDGLYTAPTDEALRYDIEQTKAYGFNMIRKHVKVEPARWYTHCDQLGILVWQDMPSGDKTLSWQNMQYYEGSELQRSSRSEEIYRKEWKEIIDNLYSYPSIVTWVPFNEAWGQFKTKEIVEWTKSMDPSRLVNPASGGNHFNTGDMLDLHHYPGPSLYLYDAMRPTVLGEYGGIGLVLEDHLWDPDRNWGYVQYKNSKDATDTYVQYATDLANLVAHGFSAAVYTQTTDVEIEVNGLMTYDREIEKLDKQRVREANKKVIETINK